MYTNRLQTLKIHKLTQEQYNRAYRQGNIEQNALYLTPDNTQQLINAAMNKKADISHSHTATQLGMGTYITQTGQANGMHYRKYSDGTAECWGIININITSTDGSSPNLYSTLPLAFTQFDSASVTNLIWDNMHQPDDYATVDLLANAQVTVWHMILQPEIQTFIINFGTKDGWGKELGSVNKLRIAVHIWGRA